MERIITATVRSTSLGSVLVTGGAGFIGCSLSQRLASLAGRYVVVDNLHPQVHPSGERPSSLHVAAELVVGDVVDASTWDKVFKDFSPDVVIHLAAETGTGQSLTESSRHGLVNVVGTTQLLDGMTRHGRTPEHVLLSSSRAVYGEGAWLTASGQTVYPGQRTHAQLRRSQWDVEGATSQASSASSTRPDPTSVYGATKLAQENILAAWCRAVTVPLTVLRLQNVYGPGQSLTNSYTGIVALFSQLAAKRQVIPVYEDGRVTRDFVYIEDIASAFLAAVCGPRQPLLVADIGCGRSTSLMELAGQLASHHGAPAPVVNGLFRDGDVRHASCTLSAARDHLGWQPAWDLGAGLAALQEWLPQAPA